MTVFPTTADIEHVRQLVAAQIPAEASRYGWNVRDLAYNIDADARERWSVSAVGPAEVSVRYLEFVGGQSVPTLELLSGTHGTIEARTADDLVRLVGDWFRAIWPASLPR